MALRNLEQEHILLVNEREQFALVPYTQVEKVAGVDAPARAFIFEHQGSTWVTYWHTSGEAVLQIALPSNQIGLMKDMGKPLPLEMSGEQTKLPLGERRFVQLHNVTKQEAIRAFQNATILQS